MENQVKRGSFEMTAAMLIAGTIGWFVLVSGQPVLDVVFWRCVFGAGALLLICALMGFLRPGQLSWTSFAIALVSGIAIVGNWVLLFAAYSRVSIGMLAITQSHGASAYGGEAYLSGILLALGAAFLYAVAAVLVKRLTGTTPHLIALIQVCTGVLLLAPFAQVGALAQQPASAWSALLVLGIVHTGLMYVLLYSAIQKLPTAITGALSFIYPIAAIAVDWIAFGQRLQWLQWFGVAAILLAAAAMRQGWTLGLRRRERYVE